jgi:hypothetical protein
MRVVIVHDSLYGNGEKLALLLKDAFPAQGEVEVAHIRDVSPEGLAGEPPDLLVLGAAIRKFLGGAASRKWLSSLKAALGGRTIAYGAGFLTHGLPSSRIQGWARRYQKALQQSGVFSEVYTELLTAKVADVQGPLINEDLEKAKTYIKDLAAVLHG